MMDALYDLGLINVTIPAWQLALYIGLFSFFMLRHAIRGCLLTTYLFGLYWAYYLFGREFLAAAAANPHVLTTYIVAGCILGIFSLASLFYES
jgi:hypothetical protein